MTESRNIQAVKVASVLDDFSFNCFKYECSLIPLSSSGWMKTMADEEPDLLLVEPAWNSIFQELFRQYGTTGQTPEIIEWCRAHKIPTVFWNKDDSVHYHTFIHIAKYFDYIFTTDSNCVEDYIQAAGPGKVYVLPFAAQPKLHNPIDKDAEKWGNVAFAGTWYAMRPERAKDMKMLLKPALKYGLHIYDRKHLYTLNDYYKFPYEYQPYILGALPYEHMVSVYKKYPVFINVNTIKDSPTMFSRRVFELLACGTSVISNYSPGIEKLFPDIVKFCKNEKDTDYYLGLLTNDKNLRDRLSLQGLRKVLNGHTYTDRMQTVLNAAGIQYQAAGPEPVSIVACTNKQDFMKNIFENYERQLYADKELIIVLNNGSLVYEEWVEKAGHYENVRVFRIDEEKTLGECLNFAVEQANGSIIAKFDDDDYYAPHYIGDMIHCFSYTDAAVVGKYSYYCCIREPGILALRFPGLENRYSDFLSGSTMVAKKDVFNKVKFKSRPSGTDTLFYRDCVGNGIKLYSSDRFNYLCMRYPDTELHTWNISSEEFLKKCSVVPVTDSFIEYVTV